MKTFLSILCCLCSVFGLCQQVTQIEYYIDADKGYNKNTKINVTPSADSNFAFTVDVSTALPGYHKLYIRSRDSLGRWSLTARRNIEVLSSAVEDKVTAGEYFFDTDPGYAKGSSINVSPKDTAIQQNFTPKVNNLQPGFHKLYARFKDTYGNWSQTTRRNVEIIKSIDTANIIAAEYFFDTDPGVGKAVYKTFTNPSADGKFKLKISYNKIPANADTLFLRVTNSDNDWCITKLVKIKVTSSLAPAFVSTDAAEEMKRKEDDKDVFSAAVYPNPVKGNNVSLTVYSPSKASLRITMYSMEGKIVSAQKQNIDAGKTSKQINLHSLAAGTYLLQVTNGVHKQTIRLLKE